MSSFRGIRSRIRKAGVRSKVAKADLGDLARYIEHQKRAQKLLEKQMVEQLAQQAAKIAAQKNNNELEVNFEAFQVCGVDEREMTLKAFRESSNFKEVSRFGKAKNFLFDNSDLAAALENPMIKRAFLDFLPGHFS